MNRWQRSMHLVGISWRVLRRDLELIALPVLALAVVFCSAAGAGAAAYAIAGETDVLGQTTYAARPQHAVLVVLFYAWVGYVGIFCQAAVVSGADQRLRGEDPSLRSALAGAGSAALRLLPWALVAMTVSWLLGLLSEHGGRLGQLTSIFARWAWRTATFLVVPGIVLSELDVVDAFDHSRYLVGRTWGETVLADAGIGVVGIGLMLPSFGGMAFVIWGSASVATTVAVGVAAAVWLLAVLCWTMALAGILQAALYRYATDEEAPAAFADAGLDTFFAPRSQVLLGTVGRGGGTVVDHPDPRRGQRHGFFDW